MKKWLLLLIPACVSAVSIVMWRRTRFTEPNESGGQQVDELKVDEKYAVRDKTTQITEHFHAKEFFNPKWKTPNFSIDVRAVMCAERLRTIVGEFLGKETPLKVLSGYRSKAQNEECKGVKNSMHLFGKAIDMATPDGLTTDKFAELAKQAGFSGVGRYREQHFVHGDIGRKREWIG